MLSWYRPVAMGAEEDKQFPLPGEGREGKEEMVSSDPHVFLHSCKSYILST